MVVFPPGQLLLRSAIAGVFALEEAPSPDYLAHTGAVLALRPHAFRASAECVRNLSDFLRNQQDRYEETGAPLLLITGEGDAIVPSGTTPIRWSVASRALPASIFAEPARTASHAGDRGRRAYPSLHGSLIIGRAGRTRVRD